MSDTLQDLKHKREAIIIEFEKNSKSFLKFLRLFWLIFWTIFQFSIFVSLVRIMR